MRCCERDERDQKIYELWNELGGGMQWWYDILFQHPRPFAFSAAHSQPTVGGALANSRCFDNPESRNGDVLKMWSLQKRVETQNRLVPFFHQQQAAGSLWIWRRLWSDQDRESACAACQPTAVVNHLPALPTRGLSIVCISDHADLPGECRRKERKRGREEGREREREGEREEWQSI